MMEALRRRMVLETGLAWVGGLLLSGCLHGAGGGALDASWRAPDLNRVDFKKAPAHEPVVLVENGEARGRIVVLESVDATVLGELHHVFEATTGTRLPGGALADEGPLLVIGDNPEARAAGIDPAALGPEGFAIKTAPNRVFIVGSAEFSAAGRNHGVTEFMERFLGVRWYWHPHHGGRSTVAQPTLAIPPVWIEDAPVFRKRENWPTWGGGGPYGELGTLHRLLRQGNSWPINLQVHTPRWGNVPAFREVPERFQLQRDGSRDWAQICYGSPETFELYVAEIARVFDEGQPADPNRMGIVGNAISVSDPADKALTCQCDHCQKLWDEDAGPYGRASRIIADFVQRLAHVVKERWPDKTIIFLPYTNYTEAPAGYRFPGNVEVQICGMPGIAQYKEPSQLEWEQRQIDGWMAISGRPIQNWHYSCWPEDRTRVPYHYPNVLKRYYQVNRDKIVGTFINGVTDHWPRQHFSLYTWFKVLWNPDFDVDAAVDAHCRRMYGPAAKTMRELLGLQITRWEDTRWPGGVLTPKAIYEHSFTSEVVERMRELIEQARREIGDDPLLNQRLDFYAIPFEPFFREYQFVMHGEGVRPLVVPRVGERPIIDGKLDDPVWAMAQPVPFFVNVGDGKQAEPDFPTELRAIHTPEAVIFGFRNAEPDLHALSKGPTSSTDDGAIWHNDCVEIFFDVTGENQGKLYQLIITPGGGHWTARHGDTAWELEGLEIGVHIDEAGGFWSLEVVIPTAGIPEVDRVGTGVEWFGQFTRHRYGPGKRPGATRGVSHENQKMNAQFGGFNSNLGDFAPVIFVE